MTMAHLTLDSMQPFLAPDAEYILFGVGRNYNLYRECLKGRINVKYCVDNDKCKQGTMLDGVEIKSPEVLLQSRTNEKILIVTGSYCAIRDQLLAMGYKNNVDFCYIRHLVPLLHWHRERRLFVTDVSFLITLNCTLRCKHCSLMVPYNDRARHRTLESLVADVDLLFKQVDFVYNFKVMGGEPTMTPHLDGIIDHLGANYRKKIGQLRIVTNATVPLKESTLALFEKWGVEVEVNDYSEFVSYAHGVDQYLAALKSHAIRYVNYRPTKKDKWVDFGDLSKPNGLDESQVRDLFDGCAYYSRGLYDKKLYYCTIECGLVALGAFVGAGNDYLPLDTNDTGLKERLFSFETGGLPLGYTTLCRNCNGDYDVNKMVISAGEQLPRCI
jgi:hypothetical protein